MKTQFTLCGLLLSGFIAAALMPRAVLPAPGDADRNPQIGAPAELNTFLTEVPPHDLDIVLGRPSKNAITLSVLSYQNREAALEYNAAGAPAVQRRFTLAQGQPNEIVLRDLQPDTRYVYRLKTRLREAENTAPWQEEAEHSFRTARAVGEKFVFTIQADSHLDTNTSPPLYARALQNQLADAPDFMIDLGDTFMAEKHPTREGAARQYLAQRYYFGSVAHSAPLFLVLGNHDGEGARWNEGEGSLAAWSQTMRTKYFPNPLANDFYSGNAAPLQNYYAWEWGDAQFIALDPFWYTPRQRRDEDNWTKTLGATQYNWLKQTLENSRARFRFVFIHHLVGGLGKDARGGSEAAPFWEWGGQNADGTAGFAAHRPGWEAPIHALLVKHHVNAVFHGHDHLFVKQDLDGIVYQEVPQPGYARYDNTNPARSYGYASGELQGSSGHLRVTVDKDQATVDYVRAYLPQHENALRPNRRVSYSYTLRPR